MRDDAGQSRPPNVLVVLPTDSAWSRGILRGFMAAAHEQRWTLLHYVPATDLAWLASEWAPSVAVIGPEFDAGAAAALAPATLVTFHHMNQTPGFDTYVAAPELFYFEPQEKWYLVFQSGPPMYSTNDDPADPGAWTAPKPFYATTPATITQNGGGWLDFWIICDAPSCHLFFSDNRGRWYQAKTSMNDFPNAFGEPVVVMQNTNAGRMFEASNVYKLKGREQFLAIIEAYDQTSNNRRYFRSWLADGLEGPWLPWQGSGSYPFAGPRNVTFDGTPWTSDISHGEMIRAGYDQTLTVEACGLRYLYQGADPLADSGGDYNKIPWHVGLLTQTE